MLFRSLQSRSEEIHELFIEYVKLLINATKIHANGDPVVQMGALELVQIQIEEEMDRLQQQIAADA